MMTRLPWLLAVLFWGAPLLAVTPRYEGIWVISESADDGLSVSFPKTTSPGASLLITPDGTGSVTAECSARIELYGKGFSGAHFVVNASLPGGSVVAKSVVDGEVIELFQEIGEFSIPISIETPLSTLQFDFAAKSAPPDGWFIQIEGIVFDRNGWQIAYSPDSAGLDVWIDSPDTVRFGIDPDWAELGWPLVGSVSAMWRPAGGLSALQFTYRQTLPPGAFVARVGIDGEWVQLVDSGPFPAKFFSLSNVSGDQLELSLTTLQSVPGDTRWTGVFENLVAAQTELSDTLDATIDSDSVSGMVDTVSTDLSDTPKTKSVGSEAGCHGSPVSPAPWWVFCFTVVGLSVLLTRRLVNTRPK